MSHHFDDNFIKKHISTGDVEGGACLNRHEGGIKDNSCAHRWQAYKHAEDDSNLYNWPSYQDMARGPGNLAYKTAARATKKLPMFPQGYDAVKTKDGFMKLKPNPYDWDLGVNRGRGANFLSKWTIPYWHNAHHIIPNGILNDCLAKASKSDARLRILIRAGLLDAKYNLNYKVNMIILPMEEQVARALGLPRHLSGIEARAGERKEFRSHITYSTNVKDRVEPVINNYKEALVNATKDHPDAPNELSKEQLIKASKDIYKNIKKWGSKKTGEPLSRMPKTFFS